MDAPLLARALDLAVRAHEGQRRKGGSVPYVVHPLRVMARVRSWGLDDDEVLAAATLHDTVEDTRVTLDDVRRGFGERVAALVDALTHASGLSPRERTRVIVEKLERAPAEAVVVKLADRLDNVLDMPAWRATSRRGYLEEAREIGAVAERRAEAAPAESAAARALRVALAEYGPVVARLLAEAERDVEAERARGGAGVGGR